MKYYTYVHYAADSDLIYYVGEGKDNRLNFHYDRNQQWQNYRKEHGVRPKIIAYWNTKEEAILHETLLISIFRELKHPLTNQNTGGKAGYRHTIETIKQLKIPKQKYTCIHCKKIVGGKSNLIRWHNNNCKENT